MTAAWVQRGFLEAVDDWVAVEEPPEALRWLVTEWIFTRMEDPYAGVRRQADVPNLWFGVIRGSAHAGDAVVVCSYWIDEAAHTVRCDRVATLHPPL